jgi:hypothetical protein
MSIKYYCFVCGEIVQNFIPRYCCSGDGCCCGGLPIEPPICSEKCWNHFMGIEEKEDDKLRRDKAESEDRRGN